MGHTPHKSQTKTVSKKKKKRGKGNQIGEVDTNDVLNASVMKIIKASAKNCSEVDIMAVKERLKADPNYKLYKRRFRFIPKLMTFLSIVAILQAPSFLFMLAAFAIMYVWIDVYSGILHVNLDNPNFLSNPVISESVLEFHWHHRFPQDIATRCFADVCGDLNMLLALSFFSSERSSAQDVHLQQTS